VSIVEKIARDWEDAQAAWDSDDVWGWQWGGQASLDQVSELIAPHVYGRVLEVGCGGGKYTRLLLELADEVVATDVHELAIAQTKAYAPEAEVVLIDGEGLIQHFKRNSFDMVVSLDVMQHLPQTLVQKYLFDAYKVANNVIIDLPDISTEFGQEHYHRAVANKVWRKLFDLGYMTYYHPAQIEVMLEMVGWEPIWLGEVGCLGPRDVLYLGRKE
jgi:SAM-dependent methyltransferase